MGRWIWRPFRYRKNVHALMEDGYQAGDFFKAFFGYNEPSEENTSSSLSDNVTDMVNDHNVNYIPDENGYQQVEITPADPTSSAANVINYDPSKSSTENMLAYAQANNSASAYNDYLQTLHGEEMSNSAISRAIADAEANGISKYQLFQSGNMAASTPSSGSSLASSYENAMNRRNAWNVKELEAIVKIFTSVVNAAAKIIT